MRLILVTHDVGAENLDFLKARYPGFEFIVREKPDEKTAGDAEIIFGWINTELLASADHMKWFHSASAGVDHFLADVERLRKELLVSNSAGVYGVPISEHLLAMMLAFAHRVNLSVQNMPAEKWGGLPRCFEIHGSTVGIVGLGDIGGALAGLLAPFGCEVLAFKRTPAEKPAGVSEMLYGEAGLDKLMARCDHVCVCLPGSPGTAGMIDRRRLGLMKKTAHIYNIGRGAVIDTDALVEALSSGAIAGAGLDVTDPEPLPPGHPLWKLPNVIITPHISGLTPQWRNRITAFFAKNLDAYIAGRPLPGLVDRVNKY